MIFFIINLVLGFLHKRYKLTQGSNFQVSLLILSVSLYFLSQLWTLNYVLHQFHLTIYFVEFIILMVFGIPVISIARDPLDPKFYKWFDLLVFITLLNVVTQIILTITGILEFREMLFVTQLILAATVVLITVAFLFTDPTKNPQRNSLFISISPILLAGVFGLASYWILGRSILVEILLLGTIIFVSMQLFRAASIYLTNSAENIKSRIYKELALNDSLTSSGSRLAFNEYVDEIIDTPAAHGSFH